MAQTGVDVVLVAPPEPQPPLGQVVYGAGGVPVADQDLGQEGRILGQLVARAVGYDTVGNGVLPGVEGREGGVRGDAGAEEALSQCALRGQPVDVRAGRPGVAVTP